MRCRHLVPSLAVAASALAAAACDPVQNMLEPAGPAAARIATLGWFVLIVFCVVTVIMWVITFWYANRHQGSLDVHMPYDAPEDRRWVLVGGFIIPAVILCVIFVWMLHTMSSFPMGDGEMNTTAADVRVIGHQWWWEVQYLQGDVHDHVVSANEIHIPVGKPVDIELRSHDVIHSFWIPRLHGKVDLVPGYVNRIRIQADRPGTYRGQCAEYCGPQHAHMILYVVAQPPQEFQAWLNDLRKPAEKPVTEAAQLGEQQFMTHQCVLCHTIRGTDAHGLVGPDLTHIGSRIGIASNTLPNNKATLSGWVTHAQSIKPYVLMPNITAFKGDELQQLVAYLQNLK